VGGWKELRLLFPPGLGEEGELPRELAPAPLGDIDLRAGELEGRMPARIRGLPWSGPLVSEPR
jgi:hypothetical protein